MAATVQVPARQAVPEKIDKRARFASDVRSPSRSPTRIKKSRSDGSENRQYLAQHPLGILPLGNAYFATENRIKGPDGEFRPEIRSSAGFFGHLPDELLMSIVESMPAKELVELGKTCRLLYAFTRADEVWRSSYVKSGCPPIKWRGSWRRSVLGYDEADEAELDCSDLFSDVLHRPFQCANLDPGRFAAGIPKENAMARLDELSYDDFVAGWVDRPFLLTGAAKGWPAMADWTVDRLLERYGHVEFQAEAVTWPLAEYVAYMRTTRDESPLYLFDHAFAEKMGVSSGVGGLDGDGGKTAPAWTIPDCFSRDLFTVLGQNRPHHRWLILGPRRSGSTFHKDPNGTSAWNGVVTGSKYWLLFPPGGAPPPGVFVSGDGAEVTAPVSVAEYLLGFHAAARRAGGAVEAVCGPGEVVYVPAGWFHMVVNLADSLALTQNFVPPPTLPEVLAFVRDRPGEVSGFDAAAVPDPHALFVDRLRQAHPAELAAAEEALRKRAEKAESGWDRVLKPAGGEDAPAFSFGFSF